MLSPRKAAEAAAASGEQKPDSSTAEEPALSSDGSPPKQMNEYRGLGSLPAGTSKLKKADAGQGMTTQSGAGVSKLGQNQLKGGLSTPWASLGIGATTAAAAFLAV